MSEFDFRSRVANISRSDLRAIVEEAIELSGDALRDPAKEDLRSVARTAVEVGRGSFSGPCDCPMVQAGLIDRQGCPTRNGLSFIKDPYWKRLTTTTGVTRGAFWGHFDALTFGLKSAEGVHNASVLRVVSD